jgi:hypothetical protein
MAGAVVADRLVALDQLAVGQVIEDPRADHTIHGIDIQKAIVIEIGGTVVWSSAW